MKESEGGKERERLINIVYMTSECKQFSHMHISLNTSEYPHYYIISDVRRYVLADLGYRYTRNVFQKTLFCPFPIPLLYFSLLHRIFSPPPSLTWTR